MRIDKLEIGMEFKNYTLLCEVLEIQQAKGGRNLSLQKIELQRFFDWDTQGRKIIITEIYESAKEKVDNRGKSEGSRGNNDQGVYGKFLDELLLYYFQRVETNKLEEKYYTTNLLGQITGFCHENYRLACEDKYLYYSTTYKSYGTDRNYTSLIDFFTMFKGSMKGAIRGSLDRLQNKKAITCEECYIIINLENDARAACEQEEQIIKMIDQKVLDEMGIKEKKELQYSDKLRKEYYTKVRRYCQEQLEHCKEIFVGYEVYILKNSPVKATLTQEEYLTKKKELNELVIKRTKEKINDKYKRNTEKLCKMKTKLGSWKKEITNYDKERVNLSYIVYSDFFVKELLELGVKSIKDKMEKQKKINEVLFEKDGWIKLIDEIEDL